MGVDLDFQLDPAHVPWLFYLYQYFYLLTAKHATLYLPRPEKTRAAGKRYNLAESKPEWPESNPASVTQQKPLTQR